MNKKNQAFIRIMCWILAGVMAAGGATTLLAVIFS